MESITVTTGAVVVELGEVTLTTEGDWASGLGCASKIPECETTRSNIEVVEVVLLETETNHACAARQIHAVKTYMGLKVRKIFDPPTTGPLINSLDAMIAEWEWRLNVEAEPIAEEVVTP